MPSPLQSSDKARPVLGKVWADGRCGWSEERESRESGVDDIAIAVSAAQADGRAGGIDARIESPTLAHVEKHLPPLGLSSVVNSHSDEKPRAKRGSGGLTSHGKKVIFNACDYLQWRFGQRNLSFTTVTMPSVTDEQGISLVKEWSEIVRVFIQNLRRKLNAKNLPDWIVGATEVQELRERSCAFPPLHLHIVYVARHPKRGWAVTPRQVRAAWRSAIVSRVPELSDLDYSAVENVQQVRKSCSSYLSKYVSKGRRALGDVDGTPYGKLHPSSWYTCTIHLSRLVRGVVRTGRRVGAILSGLSEEHFVYRRRITAIGGDGLPFTVGWAGLLKKGWSRLIGISTYRPPDEYLYLGSKFYVPRIPHDGYDYLFAVRASIHYPIPCSDHHSVADSVG